MNDQPVVNQSGEQIEQSRIPRFVFFGSSRLSVIVLDELAKVGLYPQAIVTTPDKPQGRKLILTPNVVKTWATQNDNPTRVHDFSKLDQEAENILKQEKAEVFIVASYGKIIPAPIIDIPPGKTLNIHPSLLPRYRGASPLQQAILDDTKKTGVTIMQMDELMDHGPIVAQKEIVVNEWPAYEDFEEMMAKEGTSLLLEILPAWLDGKISTKEQDHSLATKTRKFTKEDGLIHVSDFKTDPYLVFRKIQAFHNWPQAYFFINRAGKDLRVKITAADFKNGRLIIEKVIPEGSREMSYRDLEWAERISSLEL